LLSCVLYRRDLAANQPFVHDSFDPQQRPFASSRLRFPARELPQDVGEDRPEPPAPLPPAKVCKEPRGSVRVKTPPRKGKATVPAEQGTPRQAAFVWD
jgi:hypothetical protein